MGPLAPCAAEMKAFCGVVLLFSFLAAVSAAGGWGHENIKGNREAQELLEQVYLASVNLAAEDVELVSVYRQIVAGVNYKYNFNVKSTQTSCQVVIFYQSWTNTREVLSENCEAAPKSKRAITGGWNDIDVDDEAYSGREILNFYLESVNSNEQELELISVQRKVVAGSMYKFTFHRSNQNCEVVVFDQAWTGARFVVSDSCKAAQLSGGGGWGTENIKGDSTAQDILDTFYFASVNIKPEELELTAVFRQVVAGFNYRYVFNVLNSKEVCEVVIFYQWWTETREILSDSCVASSAKYLRALPKLPGAGMQEADLNDPFYNRILNSMYFLHTHVTREDITLTRIQAQKIPGMIVKYTFTVVSNGEGCEVVVNGMRQDVGATITKDTCTAHIPKPEEEDWTKREVAMPGGWLEQDVLDEEFDGILEETFFGNSEVGFYDIHLTKIETQVSAGFNIRYTFDVAGTNDECIVVIYKRWNGDTKILKDTCTDAVTKRGDL